MMILTGGAGSIGGRPAGAAVQGTKVGGTKMMEKEKRMPGGTKRPSCPGHLESIDPALITGLVIVSIKKLICLIVNDIDLLLTLLPQCCIAAGGRT
jgi:hypothetical protein